jgi:quinol monooxygenase YgiN
MTKEALFVRLEAKPGKETDVEQFLRGGLQLVNREGDTISWYAIRLGPSTFGIFDTFRDEKGRQAHLNGEVAKALMARSSELFSKQPSIEKASILAQKMPVMEHVN